MRQKIILLCFLVVLSSCRRIDGKFRYYQFPDITTTLEGGTYTIETDELCRIRSLIDDASGIKYYKTAEHELTAPGITIREEYIKQQTKEKTQIIINVAPAYVPNSWGVKFMAFVNKEYSLNIKQE